jgi:Carboxypeptidase regulatory-like domain
MRNGFCWALFLLISTGLLLGQSGPTGGLSGTITDPTGHVVPEASIEVKNPATGFARRSKSNAEGYWDLRSLPTGPYHVRIEAPGFQTTVLTDVRVEAAVVQTVSTQLRIGPVTEAVTVVGEVPLVTTTSVTTARQINTLELLQVPTSTRSFTHLLSAEPGVSADLPPVLINGNGNISPSVNGLRTTSNSVQFNGVDATNLSSNEGSLTDNISPAPETLEEVKLQTSLYDASVGRSGGGNFQLITKSGANEYHGSAYMFAQNEIFNANDFFFNRDGIDRPKASRYEGGFTIGGPIRKDRVFFFGGYQRTDAETGFVPSAQSLSHLPEALNYMTGERTADSLFAAFKQANPRFTLNNPDQISDIGLRLMSLRNPATGDYVVPSPAGKTVLGRTTDAAGNPLALVRQVFPASFKQDQFTGRLDGQLSALNRLSGILFFANYPGFDPFPDPSSMTSPFVLKRNDRARTLSVTDIHTFGASMTNEARFGLHLLNNSRLLNPEFDALTNESVGIPNPAVEFDSRTATRRLGHFIFRGPRISFGGPNDSYNTRDQWTTSFSDTLSYFRGNHSLRLGGEWKRHRYNTDLPEEQATEFEKFASFDQLMRGLAQEADTQFGITQKSFRMTDLSFFVADDWKLTPKLTLNFGFRWDWFGWPYEKDGRIGNFDFTRLTDLGNPTSGFIVPSNVRTTRLAAVDGAIAASASAGTRHTLNGQDWNNFQPRLGFAYSPSANGRLVVRGGYGVFYDRPSAAFMNTVFSNYPFLRESEVRTRVALFPWAVPGLSRICNSLSIKTFPIALCSSARPTATTRCVITQESRAEPMVRQTRSTLQPACPFWATSPRLLNSALSIGIFVRPTFSNGILECNTNSPRTTCSRCDTSARRALSCCRQTPSIRATT